MVTYCAVLMAREDKDVIEQVVDYYIEKGASRVAVFFDGDPDFEIDDRDGRLDLIPANDSFFEKVQGETPKNHVDRQMAIYRYAIDASPEDWLFFVDCDEFLVSDIPISEALARVPDSVEILRVRNVEAIWGPGDDKEAALGARWFRKPANTRLQRLFVKFVYPGLNAAMTKGLAGYTEGKHFVRARRTYKKTSVHFSIYNDGRPGEWAHEVLDNEMFLCHYDAMSLGRWRQKFLFRLSVLDRFGFMRGPRLHMIETFKEAASQGDGAMRALFERLYCPQGWRLKLLERLGLAFRRDIFK